MVDYYWRAILKASSEEQLFCIQAKKSIRGKVRGLGFDHGTFTNEQIRSEDFIMELISPKNPLFCEKNLLIDPINPNIFIMNECDSLYYGYIHTG